MKTSSSASESRRSFLKASLAAAAAGCLLGRSRSAFADISGMTFGVQLYMLRRQATTDLAGVFRAIHDANFAQVELYPIAYNHPAPELRRMVEDAGLGAVAGHFDYPGLEGKLDYAQQLGLKYLVCPMIPRDQWTSLAGFGQAADLFNRVGKQLQARGMEFVFHNHDYEFRPLEGSTGFNHLMQHTDPALVKLEFDLYWLTQAGQDPLAMMKTHADRLRLIHLKDRLAGAVTSYTPDAPQYFTELGQGTIPWRSLLLQAHAQGIQYAFVDQDETKLPLAQSLSINRAYLRNITP
jgi:sugar phosphate isomerase/epimerase